MNGIDVPAPSKAWTEGFRAGISHVHQIAEFWRTHDYGTSPSAPENPYDALPEPLERPLLLQQAHSALVYAMTAADRAARKGSTREDKRESGEAYEAAEKAIAALAAPLPAPSEREAPTEQQLIAMAAKLQHAYFTGARVSVHEGWCAAARAALSVPCRQDTENRKPEKP